MDAFANQIETKVLPNSNKAVLVHKQRAPRSGKFGGSTTKKASSVTNWLCDLL
jgi:hypothetical protein